MMKIALSFVGGFGIGLLIVLGWSAYTSDSDRNVPAVESAPENMQVDTSATSSTDTGILSEDTASTTASTAISVNDQLAGSEVTIASVTLENDGWVVVHEEKDGLISNALGAVRRDAGTYTVVTIPLLRSTQSDQRYWVVLYTDNGDRQFSIADDAPVRLPAQAGTNVGEPITNAFTAQ